MVENARPQIPDAPITLTKAQKRRKIIVLLSALIGLNLLVFGSLYFSVSKTTQSKEKIESKLNPTPAPFAFQEMTIPYLRSRGYKSKFGELKKYSETANYTSYLTSYDSDGLKINGLLTKPAGEEPKGGWPAIVFVHGYIPPSTYVTTEKYTDYVDYLARNGYVVFKIDLRGHGDSEGTARGGYYSGDYVIDALNARAALESTEFVNPKKIGFWGHSMAGNIVSRSIAARPDIPAAVIWGGAVYSYADRLKYGINDNSYRLPANVNRNGTRRNQVVEKYKEFDPNNSFWKLVPMTNYLSDIKTAISLNHAVDDDVVNIGYSRDLNALLDKTSIPHELNEYPSGGHNISGPSFVVAMQNTVNFFNKYLVK